MYKHIIKTFCRIINSKTAPQKLLFYIFPITHIMLSQCYCGIYIKVWGLGECIEFLRSQKGEYGECDVFEKVLNI